MKWNYVTADVLRSSSLSQVINFTMPSTVKHYVHRVGRTARAGRSGRSVSLVGESERKILKEVVKSAKTSVKARVLPSGTRSCERDRADGCFDSAFATIVNPVIVLVVSIRSEISLRCVLKPIDLTFKQSRAWYCNAGFVLILTSGLIWENQSHKVG